MKHLFILFAFFCIIISAVVSILFLFATVIHIIYPSISINLSIAEWILYDIVSIGSILSSILVISKTNLNNWLLNNIE